jgi:hypothetical protein
MPSDPILRKAQALNLIVVLLFCTVMRCKLHANSALLCSCCTGSVFCTTHMCSCCFCDGLLQNQRRCSACAAFAVTAAAEAAVAVHRQRNWNLVSLSEQDLGFCRWATANRLTASTVTCISYSLEVEGSSTCPLHATSTNIDRISMLDLFLQLCLQITPCLWNTNAMCACKVVLR